MPAEARFTTDGPAPTTTPAATLVGVAGVVMEVAAAGVLWWADERLLVVSDLHLEKGSAYAMRGQLVPPYDTPETLARLAREIARFDPAVVVSLGDSFHDDGGAGRMALADVAALGELQRGRTWIWIAGNHDPDGSAALDGDHAEELAFGPLTLRHEPTLGDAYGEIAGHLHPVARVYGRGRSVRRKCFAGDGRRLVMPAFGAYTGGLDLRHAAFACLFAKKDLRAFCLGEDRVYAVGPKALRP